MPEPHPRELPPLGEPTPALVHHQEGAWYRSRPVAAAVGLLIGVLVGFGLGRSLDDGSGEESASNRPPVQPSVVTSSTTVPAAPELPGDCAQALRSAEAALQLLEQGFQNLRRFEVERVEEVLADLNRLRVQVTERVVACQEQLRR